jgi:hypothetical protein
MIERKRTEIDLSKGTTPNLAPQLVFPTYNSIHGFDRDRQRERERERAKRASKRWVGESEKRGASKERTREKEKEKGLMVSGRGKAR